MVTNEISNQLGTAAKIHAMTGAVLMLDESTKSVTISGIKNSPSRITHVKVTLDGNDEYTVKFISVRGYKMKIVSEHCGIQSSILKKFIEDTIKLRLTL